MTVLRKAGARMARIVHRARSDERGQSTVEAAFALPVVLCLVLLLVQPGIILYDCIVMQGAAAEGCRLLATLPSGNAAQAEDYVLRRLSAVPQHDLFHVHTSDACTWSVELEGNEESAEVSVAIATELKPVPLIGAGEALLGLTNSDGNLKIKVEAHLKTQPDWVASDDGVYSPSQWIGAWT